MSEPDFLSTSRVAIVGLGLMGGSLALALRGRCQSLLACERDPDTLELAKQLNLFERISHDPADILPEADVVILATPLKSILDLIAQLPDLHPGSPIVLDLGSTKVQVVNALASLPPRFDPLGGHPMCGKETTGLDHAEPELYQGATFAYAALERTSDKARIFAEQLASAIGSYPLWIDPETHDQWSAATSHLPYLVAAALAASVPFQSKPLVGSGFRSTTRIAATPPAIMLDVLETNRKNILESLVRFREQLDQLVEHLSNDDYPPLMRALEDSAEKQRKMAASSMRGEAL